MSVSHKKISHRASIESRVGDEGDLGRAKHGLLPISPSFLSSNRRKRFRLDISRKPEMDFSDQSSMISAWVLSRQIWSPISSAILSRS